MASVARRRGETTVYAVRYPIRRTRVRVVFFPAPRRLDVACRSTAVEEAVVGGFFVRDPYRPLGEVAPPAGCPPRAAAATWGRAARRGEQRRRRVGSSRARSSRAAGWRPPAGRAAAGRGRAVSRSGADHEGFSAGADQFDSDITQDRHPRGARGSATTLIAVACDGRRSNVDAGRRSPSWRGCSCHFGAERAINLDGGGSTTLVHRGHLLNRPYSNQDQPAPQTRRVVTALLFVGADV